MGALPRQSWAWKIRPSRAGRCHRQSCRLFRPFRTLQCRPDWSWKRLFGQSSGRRQWYCRTDPCWWHNYWQPPFWLSYLRSRFQKCWWWWSQCPACLRRNKSLRPRPRGVGALGTRFDDLLPLEEEGRSRRAAAIPAAKLARRDTLIPHDDRAQLRDTPAGRGCHSMSNQRLSCF